MKHRPLTKQHVASEITLLCDMHHREKTQGLLPLEHVKQADKQPYNLINKDSSPYNLHYSGDQCSIIIGSTSYTLVPEQHGDRLIPICVDSLDLISFRLSDNHVLLSLNAYDRDNRQILKVKDNELIFSASPWDIEFIGKKMTIHEKHHQILLDITFSPPDKVILNRGFLLKNGVEFYIRPEGVYLVNCDFGIEHIGFVTSRVFVIGKAPDNILPAFMQFDVPRNLSRSERNKRLREIALSRKSSANAGPLAP